MLRFLLVLFFSDFVSRTQLYCKVFFYSISGLDYLNQRVKNAQNSSNNDKIRHSSIPPVVYKSYEKDQHHEDCLSKSGTKIIPLCFINIIKGASGLVTLLVIRFLLSVLHIIVQAKLTRIVGSHLCILYLSRYQPYYKRVFNGVLFVLYCLFQIIALVTISLVSLSPFKPSSQGLYAESRIYLFFSLNIAGFPPSLLSFTKLGVILETLTRAYFVIRLILILRGQSEDTQLY